MSVNSLQMESLSKSQIDSFNQLLRENGADPIEDDVLRKALAVGFTGLEKPTERTGMGALMEESLDSVLKVITASQKNLKFWPSISMGVAKSTVEQYMRKIAYGDEGSAYVSEGGVGQEEDSTYVRDAQKLAIFSKSRSISYVASKVSTTIGDMQVEQQKDATMSILKTLERELYWGHAHFVDATGVSSGSIAEIPNSSIEMNGLLVQMMKGDTDSQFIAQDFTGWGVESTSVIKDLAGQPLSQDAVEDGITVLTQNFGSAEQLHLSPVVGSAFVKTFYPQFRSAPGLSGQTVGYDVTAITTTGGKVSLTPNVFLAPKSKVVPGAATVKCASVAGLTVAGVAGGSGGEIEAGSYHYAITLRNDFGESAPIYTSAPVVVAAGQKVTLTITGGLPAGVKYVKVYRAASGAPASQANFIQNVKVGSAVVDAGFKKPGLGEAFLMSMGAETMEFKQLFPLTKLPLPFNSSFTHMFILCGGFFLFAPRWCYALRNVGK